MDVVALRDFALMDRSRFQDIYRTNARYGSGTDIDRLPGYAAIFRFVERRRIGSTRKAWTEIAHEAMPGVNKPQRANKCAGLRPNQLPAVSPVLRPIERAFACAVKPGECVGEHDVVALLGINLGR